MKLHVFSDCHVDGVSAVISRDEYVDKVISVLNDAKASGGIVVMLGDNEDIKNSRDPGATARLKNTIHNLMQQYAFCYCFGNHDDIMWSETNQYDVFRLTDGRMIFAQHGYAAKYGFKASGEFTPGSNWLMRAIKYVGVIYRKLRPWRLSDKAIKYISEYQQAILPSASICLSGHEHPKELTHFAVGKTHYFVFPQGYTEIEI